LRNRRRLEGRVRAVSARIKAGKECTRFSCLPLAIESRDGQTSDALTEIAASGLDSRSSCLIPALRNTGRKTGHAPGAKALPIRVGRKGNAHGG